MDRPLVSVVIPTHDRPRRVRRAIRSVERQTYEPIELVVVDDCSSQPVSSVLEREPALERFDLHRLEENRGGSAARNIGIDAATGEYLAFLDDDDRWKPTKLDRQISALEAAPAEVGLAYTGVVQLGPDGTVNAVTAGAADGDVTRQLLRRNVVGTISSVVLRRSVLDHVGGLDERFPSWQDWAFYVRVSEHTRFLALKDPLVVRHNAGTDQLSHAYETKRNITVPLFVQTFAPLAARHGRLFEHSFYGYVAYHLGLAAVRTGRYRDARRHFVRAISLYPFAPIFYLELAAVLGGRMTYEPLDRLQPYLPLRAVKRALQ